MTEHTAQSKKYAVLLNAGPANVGAAVNGLNYALRLHDAGHEVRVYLDGGRTVDRTEPIEAVEAATPP